MERNSNPAAMVRTAFLMSERHDEPSADAIEVASLIRQALAGDATAFESIIRKYERRVVSLAMKLLTRTEDAQDAAQEIFLRMYKYLHRLDVQKPIEPWLMRMTVNVCRDVGRKRQRRCDTFSESETIETPAAP